MIILNTPGGKLGVFSVGLRVKGHVVLWAEVPVSVVDADTPSVVTCTVVVGVSCAAVDISVVEVTETRPGVFVVVSLLAVFGGVGRLVGC